MDRLTRLVRWLALLTLLLGCFALYRAMQPQTLAEGLQSLRWVLVSALAPLPLGALGVWLVARWAGQYFETRSYQTPSEGKKVHPLKGSGLDLEESPGPTSVFAPRVEGRAARDRWRPRLEAHLKARRPDVVAFVDELLAVAVHAGASDLHLQPLELSTRISLRVGGVLEEVATAPQALHGQLVRRLKVLAGLVSYESRKPQDGRFTVDTPRGAVDLRVAIMPTQHGEKVVLRLALHDTDLFRLTHLGWSAAQRQQFEELLRLPQGVVVLTGPTGSGKTTTLYAGLTHIHETRGETTQLATIEDPIEVDLPFLQQTQVQRAVGMTMAESLKALLRQDPNVLMVGEVRDGETAQTAIQAGLSGHLILTTLHADSAVGVFPRLIDLGIEPFLVSSAVAATVSQRLVRRLCPDCRHPAPLDRRQSQRLQRLGIPGEGFDFQTAEGCAACERSGHRGRAAIFEVLRLDGELRRLVAQRASAAALFDEARKQGMRSLLDSALALAAAGEIEIDEALRVAG